MKHYEKRRSVSGRLFVLMLALVLVLGCAVGGTVAWLVAKTDPVVNTFTYGDINITLTETTGDDYKIIPGVDIGKDPKVTVMANSEACWLFVRVEEGSWPEFKEKNGTRKVSYSVNDGWIPLKNNPGVYFREVSAEDAQKGINYTVLAGDESCSSGVIKVSQELTKEEINSINYSANQPSLTFTAYAVQRAGIDTADAAWATVNP